MTTNLSNRAILAMRWTCGGFLLRSIAGLAVGTVLARLLGPEPFGLIGIAALLFGLGVQIADGGISSALVQAPQLSERQIRSVFTAQMLVGAGMTAATYYAAPFIGTLFHSGSVITVVRETAPVFVLQSLGQTSTSLLKRGMAFSSVQSAHVLSYLLGYAGCGIVLAAAGYGIRSLIAAQLIQTLVYSACVYTKVRHSLRPYFDPSSVALLRFGSRITGANIINWLISNIDNLIVGRVFGAVSLGLYSRAFNLASNPSEGFVGAFQQVLFAACSRVEPDRNRMRRGYLASVSVVALLCLPVFLTISAASYPIVAVLYGPRWSEAAPLLCAFTVAMPMFCVMGLAGPVLAASDNVTQEIRAQAVSLIVCVAVFLTASLISLRAVAISVPIVYAFRLWRVTRPTLLLLGLRWVDLCQVVAGPTVAGLITAACVNLVWRLSAPDRVTGVLGVIMLAAVGIASFGVILTLAPSAVIPQPVWLLIATNKETLPAAVVRLFNGLRRRRIVAGSSLESQRAEVELGGL